MKKTYKDGGVYEGESTLFTKKRQGQGKMIYKNGEIYEGEWKDDVRHGKGRLYLPKAFGEMYSYEGEWKNDQLNGKGKFTDGHITYEGDFVNGKFEGNGTLTKKLYNTSVYYSYKGSFKDGRKSGSGTETCQDYSYTGQFSIDSFHGQGKKTLKNGDFFEGQFYLGTFQGGKGRITDKDMTVYEGELRRTTPNGKGKQTFADKKVISGKFDNGKKTGKFSVIAPDGTKYTETYKDDVLVSSTENDINTPRDKKGTAKLTTTDMPVVLGTAIENAIKIAEEAYALKKKIEKDIVTKRKTIEQLKPENLKLDKKLNKYDTYCGQKNAKGVFHGFGIYTWANGAVYEGSFKYGKISGKGIYKNTAKGFTLVGESSEATVSGIRCFFLTGKGVKLENDGSEYAGEFLHSNFNGFGVYTHKDGKKDIGEFVKGELVGAANNAIENKESEVKATNTKKIEPKKKADDVKKTEENKKTAKATEVKSTAEAKSKNDVKSISTAKTTKKAKTKPAVKIEKAISSFLLEEYDKLEKAANESALLSDKQAELAREIQQKCQKQVAENKLKYSFNSRPVEKVYMDNNIDYDTFKGMSSFNHYTGFGIYTWTKSGIIYEGEFKDGNFHGLGTLIYPDGDRYEGEFKDDIMYGLGVFSHSNGDRYEGNVNKSLANGRGVYYFKDGKVEKGTFIENELYGVCHISYANGDKYMGNMKNDDLHGRGIYIWDKKTQWANDKYIGDWYKGARTGSGVYIYANGGHYEGDFVDGNHHGKGTFIYSDGAAYTGDFKNGSKHGKGVIILDNGDVYEGEYVNDKKEGQGTYTWGDGSKWAGDKYVGQWENDEICGKGVSYYVSGNVAEGTFKKGCLNGKGKITYASGDMYEGSFKDGEISGKGTYIFANGDKDIGTFEHGKIVGKATRKYTNGDVYEGDFENDTPTGVGKRTFANGDKYEGEFENGLPHGNGTYTFADGTQKTGQWIDGSLVGDDGKTIPSIEKTDNISRNEDNPNNNQDVKDNNTPKNSDDTKGKKEEKKDEPSFKSTKSGVSFSDVAGLNDVKDQIIFNVLEPLKNPELAKAYGIKPGGKILLYGPPGTGKTFIARAIAGEIDAAFYPVNCQDLNSKWVGEATELLNNLFKEARKNDRAIIFFDEFDSMAYKRDTGNSSAGVEMARFVATFLTNVDGFKTEDENKMLLLIAATNRPWAIDTAMLRGGRFDTQIYVGVPDQEAREFLINKALGALPLDEGVNLKDLATDLAGYGGGDIVAICEKIRLEAYKKSVRLGKMQNISKSDCQTAMNAVQNHISQEELARFEAYKNGQNIN